MSDQQQMVLDLAKNAANKALAVLDREAQIATVVLNPVGQAMMLNRVAVSITVWELARAALLRKPEVELEEFVRELVDRHARDLVLNTGTIVQMVRGIERNVTAAAG